MYILKRFNLIKKVCLHVIIALLIVGFSSCATSRAVSPEQEREFAVLAPGGQVYLYIDVAGARPILDTISFESMMGTQFNQFFDKTKSAVVAFYPKDAPRRFLAAAQGSYPSFQANVSLTFSSSWKKARSETGASYWHSAKDGLSVSVHSGQAFVSDGDPLVLPPGTTAPEGFAEFRKQGVLAGWLENSAAPINKFLASMEIPIQIPGDHVWFSIQKSENQYEGAIMIETPSESQAKALAAIVSIARFFMVRSNLAVSDDPMTVIASLFVNPPVQDGSRVYLHTGLLDEKGIALLFTMFSIYSK